MYCTSLSGAETSEVMLRWNDIKNNRSAQISSVHVNDSEFLIGFVRPQVNSYIPK